MATQQYTGTVYQRADHRDQRRVVSFFRTLKRFSTSFWSDIFFADPPIFDLKKHHMSPDLKILPSLETLFSIFNFCETQQVQQSTQQQQKTLHLPSSCIPPTTPQALNQQHSEHTTLSSCWESPATTTTVCCIRQEDNTRLHTREISSAFCCSTRPT